MAKKQAELFPNKNERGHHLKEVDNKKDLKEMKKHILKKNHFQSKPFSSSRKVPS